MSFDYSTLVRDRTQADVSARNTKGTYNVEDLNRVTAALDDLWQRLLSAGYTLPRYKRIKIDHVVPEPEPESRLPEGYTQVEYIESTGTQYINTGVAGSVPLRAEMTVETKTGTSAMDAMVLDSYDGTNSSVIVYWYKGTWYTEIGKTGGASASGTLADNTKYNVVFEATSAKHSLTVNGTTLLEKTGSLTGSTRPLFIFARNNNGTASHFSKARVYGLKLYSNGSLVRDYVPCTNASGVYGLYDLVNAQFYGNAGSGNFTGGEAVAVPAVSAATTATVAEEITEYDPYLWYDIDVPTAGQMAQYLANVDDVRTAFTTLSTTPATPASMELLTWAKANNIEQILFGADTILSALTAIYLRSGMVWACANGPGFYFMN